MCWKCSNDATYTSESHMKKISTSPSNENSPKNGGQSLKLPEEIADIIVIAAHEPLDNLFSQIKL